MNTKYYYTKLNYILIPNLIYIIITSLNYIIITII